MPEMRKVNTKRQLVELLGVSYERIEYITKHIDDFYLPEKREVKTDVTGKPKKNKKGWLQYRILHPSKNELKRIQTTLKNEIFSTFIFPDYVHGAVKGKSNITNARRHQGKKYKFITDLKSFFPSITHKKVYDTLIEVGFYPTMANIITQLTTYKGHLPQGTPTSSYIANLVFLKTENKYIEHCNKNAITYTRFVDDLTFSAQYDFKETTQWILDTIREDGFKISFEKTHYRTLADITGVASLNNGQDTTNRFKERHQDRTGYTDAKRSGVERYEKRIKNED